MHNKNMMCDLETGICGEVAEEDMEMIDFNQSKKTVDVYYVTDPICSHCWALEPVLRRFIMQYGDNFHFHTVMGGLLETWDAGPVDPANGIFGPADVAGHWREVGEYSRMPIDGSVMIDNPVQSSFPPSRVFKVIQHHHNDALAFDYLRRTREQLFAFNHNIAEDSAMMAIVNSLGMDGPGIIQESKQPRGQQLLDEDFALARKLGVRGFPTLVMINQENKGIKIVGSRSLAHYVDGLQQVLNGDDLQAITQPPLAILLEKEKLLFSKEIEVMYDLPSSELQQFVAKELSADTFEMKELLGEKYIKIKHY